MGGRILIVDDEESLGKVCMVGGGGRGMAGERNKRILIVEDDSVLAGLLCRILERRLGDGHQVEVCELAEEATTRLQHQQFDLLVTDLRMPDASGLELIRHVRQVSPRTHTVLITAYPSLGVEDQVRQLAVTYLRKPFEMRELVAAVQHALATNAGNAFAE